MPKDHSKEAVVARVVARLKAERERKGVSMNKLAERCALSHSAISLIEHNHRNPTLDVLLRISAALEVDLWRILKEVEARG